MAQDADNDNGARSAIDAIRAAAPNWTNYGPGGTALASSATANHATDAAPALSAAEPDDVTPDPSAVEQSAPDDVEQLSAATPAADQPAPPYRQTTGVAPHFAVTNAASLEELGIELPQRPTPRRAATQPVREPAGSVQSSAVAARPASSRQHSHTQRPASPTGPLFNTPPETPMSERADAFADAAFATTASRARPLTSQPGFLLGLISAAIVGAALYIYLA